MLSVDALKAILVSIWNYDGVRIITFGVLLNLVMAIAVAIRENKFSFDALGNFLLRELTPYVVVYYGFKLFSDGTGLEWVATAVLALLLAKIAAAIIDKLKALGVPIPERVMSLVRRPLADCEEGRAEPSERDVET